MKSFLKWLVSILALLMITVTVFALVVDAEDISITENKAGWSPACEAQAIRYCNKKYESLDIDLYKKCIIAERACGTTLFDIVYPKEATEDELWECNRKLIKLIKKNGILSEFIMYEHSYCDLLAIVLEQWPKGE